MFSFINVRVYFTVVCMRNVPQMLMNLDQLVALFGDACWRKYITGAGFESLWPFPTSGSLYFLCAVGM